jgi:hypothetical protein
VPLPRAVRRCEPTTRRCVLDGEIAVVGALRAALAGTVDRAYRITQERVAPARVVVGRERIAQPHADVRAEVDDGDVTEE